MMMRQFFSFMALSLLAAPLCMAQQKTDTVFFENFSGKNLDRSKWNVEVTGNTVNDEQ